MWRTEVRYAGGDAPNPTYHDLGGHTESLRVTYDHQEIAYGALLECFGEAHDMTAPLWSQQYASLIFVSSESQRQEAEAFLRKVAEERGKKVRTKLRDDAPFYPAEGYHQKYYLRQTRSLGDPLRSLFPREEDFWRSAAVMRANAYLAGHGSPETFERELPKLGLTPAHQNLLRRFFENAR